MSLCQTCLGGPREVEVKSYGIGVCQRCWQQAERGWPAQYEPVLLHAMTRLGLLIPDRTADGRLPRCYSPPADFNL